MTSDVAVIRHDQPSIDPAIIERVLLEGDIRRLTPSQKISYYTKVCESVGLNPLTQPFAYIVLNGKETLYAKREATEQLRRLHKVSIQIVGREVVEGCYIVTARATLPDGRCDENIGAVPIEGLKGEARSNALMKSETKAKRRVTLSICGLGMLDETEVDTLPPAIAYEVEAPALPPEAGTAAATTVQSTEPEPVLPAGALRIMRVQAVNTKNPKVKKYFVTFSNGEETSTISEWLASLCEQLCQENAPVKIDTKETKWGTELLKVKRADGGEQPPLEALDDKNIPF